MIKPKALLNFSKNHQLRIIKNLHTYNWHTIACNNHKIILQYAVVLRSMEEVSPYKLVYPGRLHIVLIMEITLHRCYLTIINSNSHKFNSTDSKKIYIGKHLTEPIYSKTTVQFKAKLSRTLSSSI
ncbi:conserved hypothetical protein [Trichinella spiralis]|uniref:hypothetical protein n=1 Tax=Trichinella spiralis TaxID=6334 RepID=UPI0001EFD9B1|nr:conserved hypothetical protein [Trichinella spiralis]